MASSPSALFFNFLLIAAALLVGIGLLLPSTPPASSSSSPPLAVVVLLLAPLTLLILFLPFLFGLPSASRPTFRSLASCTLLALSFALLAATPLATSALLPLPLALSPLAAMLILRFATVPPPPSLALGAPEADGVACTRWLSRLELPLGGASLVLLHRQLQQLEYAGTASSATTLAYGWWAVAAPLLTLESLGIIAGCRALGSAAVPSVPPPNASDRVEWVRHHERDAVCGGCGALSGGVLRLAFLCTLASQLEGGAGALPWRSAYAPYCALLVLPLSCCVCCALALPRPRSVRVRPTLAPLVGRCGTEGGEHGTCAPLLREGKLPRSPSSPHAHQSLL
jgi:hypothetical protein